MVQSKQRQIKPIMEDKKLADYLHLYLGAQVRHRYIDFEEGEWSIWYRLSEHALYKLSNDASLDKIEIQLRPLSDMTEQEKDEFIELCGIEKEDISCLERKWEEMFSQDMYGTAHLTNIAQWAVGVKYLLSKHFDLFELIESGIAINKNNQASI